MLAFKYSENVPGYFINYIQLALAKNL